MKLMTTVSAVALISAVGAQAVHAQPKTNVTEVGSRVADDYQPMGVRAGGFLVIPKVDVVETYDDNIYATTNNTDDDMITTVRPEIAVKSNWNRHSVNAVARGEFNRYSDHSKEDQDNYSIAADGRADVMRDTSIGGGFSFSRDHEERGNPNTSASAQEPTEYETAVARVGAYRGLGKLNARIDSEVRSLDYKNGQTNAGALIDNNRRDRNEYTQALRLGYKIDDRFEAFVRGSVDSRVYDRKGGAVTNRSSHGNSIVAGSAFDITGKTKGEVYAGMVDRNYVDPSLEDITKPTWGGKVTWNPSQLTTVTGAIDRTIDETTLSGSSGYVSTAYRAKVEHSLTRQWLVNAGAAYESDDYKGRTGTQRSDDIWEASAGTDYYLNRCLKAGLSYVYRDRSSNMAGGDYDRNAVMLRLTGTY